MGGSLHLHLSTVSSGANTATITRAVELAQRLGAEIEATISVIDVAPMGHWSSPYFAGAILELENDSRTRGEAFAKMVADICAAHGVEHHVTSYVVDQVADRRPGRTARTHDLSIVGLAEGDGDARRTVEDLVFGSGRPVLVLPASQVEPLVLNRVCVAWDHSEPAARTLSLALPILKCAERVDVVTLDTGRVQAAPGSARAAANYLRRHGVPAHPRTLSPDGRKPGAQLIETALSEGANLMVMGAYGTPRVKELVFGGVTRTALEKPILPLLIAN